MSDPLLNYQSTAPGAPTPLIRGTFVFIVILAVIYILFGACGGLSVAFLASSPSIHLRVAKAVIYAFALFFVLLTVGSGITFLWTGILLLRLSRIAGFVALILASINGSLAFGYDIFNVITFVRLPAGTFPAGPAIGSIILYLLAAVANGLAAMLLWLCLRQMRHMRPSKTPPSAPP